MQESAMAAMAQKQVDTYAGRTFVDCGAYVETGPNSTDFLTFDMKDTAAFLMWKAMDPSEPIYMCLTQNCKSAGPDVEPDSQCTASEISAAGSHCEIVKHRMPAKARVHDVSSLPSTPEKSQSSSPLQPGSSGSSRSVAQFDTDALVTAVHRMRKIIATGAANVPAMFDVLPAVQQAVASCIWGATFVFTVLLCGGIFAWIATVASWFLARWAISTATCHASARLYEGQKTLIRTTIRNFLALPGRFRQLIADSAQHACTSCMSLLYTATGATFAATRDTITVISGHASRAVAVVKSLCAAVARAASTAAAVAQFSVGLPLRACMLAIAAVQKALAVALGVCLWLTFMYLSALCWVGLAVFEGWKSVAGVADAYVWPLVRFAVPLHRSRITGM